MPNKVLTSEIMSDIILSGDELDRLESMIASLGSLETSIRFSNGQHKRIDKDWLLPRLRSIRITGKLPTGKTGLEHEGED